MKSPKRSFLAILLGLLIVATGCTNQNQQQKNSQQDNHTKTKTEFKIVEAKSLNVKQIYGIGYPGNDQALYLAGNNGLKMYKDTKWFNPTTNQHDYVGFQAIDKGFIASGHPEKGAGLKDPLGIVESSDKGNTLKKIAFYGKQDFYFMAASFAGQGMYVISAQPYEQLSQGMNYSKDNGTTWQKSAFKNFNADSLGMIAVHPIDGNTIGMATRSGIYYSNDYGNTMNLITEPFMVTALTFQGDRLLYSSVENNTILLKSLNPKTGEQIALPIPFLDYDNPITYLAVNPKNEKQIAFTTYKNDLYQSVDGGLNWTNLLKTGK